MKKTLFILIFITFVFGCKQTIPEGAGDPITVDAFTTVTNATQAIINFQTEKNAIVKVTFNGTEYTSEGTEHNFVFINLNPETTYQYVLEINDDPNNPIYSALKQYIKTFVTGSPKDVTFVSFQSTERRFNKLKIQVVTQENSNCDIKYGTSSGSYGSYIGMTTSDQKTHNVTISSLNSFTTYYYKIKATPINSLAYNITESNENILATKWQPVLRKNSGVAGGVYSYGFSCPIQVNDIVYFGGYDLNRSATGVFLTYLANSGNDFINLYPEFNSNANYRDSFNTPIYNDNAVYFWGYSTDNYDKLFYIKTNEGALINGDYPRGKVYGIDNSTKIGCTYKKTALYIIVYNSLIYFMGYDSADTPQIYYFNKTTNTLQTVNQNGYSLTSISSQIVYDNKVFFKMSDNKLYYYDTENKIKFYNITIGTQYNSDNINIKTAIVTDNYLLFAGSDGVTNVFFKYNKNTNDVTLIDMTDCSNRLISSIPGNWIKNNNNKYYIYAQSSSNVKFLMYQYNYNTEKITPTDLIDSNYENYYVGFNIFNGSMYGGAKLVNLTNDSFVKFNGTSFSKVDSPEGYNTNSHASISTINNVLITRNYADNDLYFLDSEDYLDPVKLDSNADWTYMENVYTYSSGYYPLYFESSSFGGVKVLIFAGKGADNKTYGFFINNK